MIYHHLFEKFGSKKKVRVGIVGAGNYATAIVTQSPQTKYLSVVALSDISAEKAKEAYEKAGIPEEKQIYCNSIEQAQKEIEAGNYIYTDKSDIITHLPPLDVVCESTGSPNASAKYALDALNNGKHVAMITKDCDSCVGPMLKKIADEKGLVYTTVDGDQHGLLIQLYEWAKMIGLTVISGGKATDGEFVYDKAKETVTIKTDKVIHPPFNESISVAPEDAKYLEMIPKGKVEEYIAQRKRILAGLPQPGCYDLCEMTVAANYTGLTPYVDTLVHAPLRITEIPVAYCEKEHGGIFDSQNTLDLATCFRVPEESGLGGGVFLVVRCDNAYSNYVLTQKGQIANYDDTAAVIYRPYHLCGVETSISILVAGLLGLNTATSEYLPRFDLAKIAARDIKAGEVFGNDHNPMMTAKIMPAVPVAPKNYAAAHLLTGNRAAVDIPKGTLITYNMVEEPADSTIWQLRRMQDEQFLQK